MNTEKRYYNIEFLRFAFAICIVYFHLLHSFMMDYTGNADLYIRLAEQSKYAKYIVECFFIISGYFLYHTIQRHPEMNHAGIYHAKDNPSVAGAGVFDHDLGGVFWKIDLCVLCGFVVFAVQRAGDGLAGTELVCVGIFCGGDFLFCAV